jgi:mono/diheme cytochrome c family protein
MRQTLGSVLCDEEKIMSKILATGLALALITSGAQPPTSPDFIAAGRRVAIRNCGECHGIDPGQPSPFNNAPPFPTLFKQYPVEGIADVLEKNGLERHPNMKAFDLGSDERDEIAAYLGSFKPVS